MHNNERQNVSRETTTTKQSNQTRKKRQTITLQLVKNVRRSYERSLPASKIADDEEVSLPTIHKIIKKISDNVLDEDIVSNKLGRKPLQNSLLRNKLSQLLLKDSSYSQKEMIDALAENNIQASQSTISRNLKKMKYSRKRLMRIPEERNTQKTIELRQNYARAINFISDENMIFLDETGVNLHQSRNYGYSPINEKAYRIVKANKGQNISCMVAIKRSGVIGFEIRDGAFDGFAFIEFIKKILIPHFRLNSNDVLVMDNCRFHHRRDVVEILNENNINHRFLPPYSPQLNPIEEYFSHFKSILNGIHPAICNREVLKEKILMIFNDNYVDFSGWFVNMRRYLEMALARREFF